MFLEDILGISDKKYVQNVGVFFLREVFKLPLSSNIFHFENAP